MTASVAMAIDSMLPALPAIGHSLGVTSTNDAQLVIGVFFLGFGISQIVFGSLSDTFGRRKILLGGLAFYVVAMFAAAWTSSFEMLLVMRFVQGIGGAAVRITTMAIVRDCFGGREMARVMSYVMIVFMIMPIVAPSVGQLIISYAELALDLHPARHRRLDPLRLGAAAPEGIAAAGRAPAAVRRLGRRRFQDCSHQPHHLRLHDRPDACSPASSAPM